MTTEGRYQAAVLWVKTGEDEFSRATFAVPVEAIVRWEYKRTITRNAQGDPEPLDAQVVMDEDVPLGSLMWLGELTEWFSSGSAGSDDEVMRVMTLSRIPDAEARWYMRSYGLAFKGDEPR